MSCILCLFGKKPSRQRPAEESFTISTALEGPLPEKDFELDLLEQHLVFRLTEINKKVNLAYANAAYMKQKGDMKRYLIYLNERRRHIEELQRISKRHMEVVEKRAMFPYTSSPPPKVETVATFNPVQQVPNVPNSPSPKLLSARPVGRPRTHATNLLSSQAPHLRGRP
jgi:hypothetical protein